jgi:hypothetical protein
LKPYITAYLCSRHVVPPVAYASITIRQSFFWIVTGLDIPRPRRQGVSD